MYWDIEIRTVPMDEDHMSINTDKVLNYVDEYTIGIVGILGITYTGKFDNIKALDEIVQKYNSQTDFKVYIHVDAASGGFFLPFINPELPWDFRLNNVISINSSGHKYGLVYPGIGWILWKYKFYLPKELIFEVNYLGGKMPTMAINFSRSASQIIGQYYNFLRLGFNGYRKIHEKTRDVAMYIANEINNIGLFHIYKDGSNLPVVCYKLKENTNVKWNLYDLADRLLMKGWQIPVYPLPSNLNNIVIERIVCRADLSYDLATFLINNFKTAISDLNHGHIVIHNNQTQEGTYGFTH